MRLTPQRRAVLALLLDHPGRHWSADAIRNQLLETMPELARGTTYKTLNELVRRGILEELATVDGVLLYGLRLEPHHHFFLPVLSALVRCGRRRGRTPSLSRVQWPLPRSRGPHFSRGLCFLPTVSIGYFSDNARCINFWFVLVSVHLKGIALQHRPQGLFLLGRSLQIAANHGEILGSFV